MDCIKCQKKDQEIEHLRRELRGERETLALVKRDLRQAAQDHLPRKSHLRLPLKTLIDLMVAHGRRKAFEEAALRLTEKILEPIVLRSLPDLLERLPEVFTIPVLIYREDDSIFYRARSLQGVPRVKTAHSPEDAYSRMRENLAVAIAEKPQRLAAVPPDLIKVYEKGHPFKTDRVIGFKVEVRLDNRTRKTQQWARR